MSSHDLESERLRKHAVDLMWQGHVEDALAVYDDALALAESDDQRELVTIGKAEALIAAEREGAEVRELPSIVMRRRTPRHVYLAGYTLMRRFSETDRQRATFYGEIARDAAMELGEDVSRAKVLNGLGIIQMIDSRFAEAIESFVSALSLIQYVTNDEPVERLRILLVQNLGGARLLNGEIDEGIRLIDTVFHRLEDPYARSDSALDLCYAYLELEKFEEARAYGEEGFALANAPRLIRNAHYLLGEIAVRTDHFEEAERHFSALESFYPDFPNLRHLLLAVDLCPILNLKC